MSSVLKMKAILKTTKNEAHVTAYARTTSNTTRTDFPNDFCNN